MHFDLNQESSPLKFCSVISEGHRGLLETGLPEQCICDRLVTHLSRSISQACIEKHVGEFATEYRLRVYVLTQDQLERLIEVRASSMTKYRPSIHEVERSVTT